MLIKIKSVTFCTCMKIWINSKKSLVALLHSDGHVRKKTHLAQSLSQLVPGVPFPYHKLPKDTHYICRHSVSSSYDKCINIRTIAFPKNTASRNSDGWHLCRQDFIQLLWLALCSQQRNKWSIFSFSCETLACIVKKARKMVLNQHVSPLFLFLLWPHISIQFAAIH